MKSKIPENLTLEAKAGQLFFPAAFINDNDEGIRETEKLIKDHQIGGLTFFHSRASAATNYEGKKVITYNKDSLQRLKELISHYQNISSIPLLISIDAEWGLAMRIENTPQYPYPITLGAVNDNDLLTKVGRKIGEDLFKAGIHLNLAPVADINLNPGNPVIGYRSFGEDKIRVIKKALAFYEGMQQGGTLGCFKHFPGHGDTTVDSHLGLPVIKKGRRELYDNELFPFFEAAKAGVDSIMVGHLAVPALSGGKEISATLSKDIITGVLREEMGYDGVVISDALNMHSVSKLYSEKGRLELEAFEAGNDALCFSENVPEGISEIIKNSSEERIERSFQRLMRLKYKAQLFDRRKLPGGEAPETESIINRRLAEKSLCLLRNQEDTIPLKKGSKAKKISIGKPGKNPFFKHLDAEISGTVVEIPDLENINYRELGDHLNFSGQVIIALYPPSVKPVNNFGLPENLINFLAETVKSHSCIFYLFGNPYVLGVLKNTGSIHGLVVAYQDFEVFQETAARHLLGEFEAVGELPVKIGLK